jgi:hypothetical protein
MKKVMTALATAATALLAFGDLPSGTSFEDLTTGEKAINALVGHTDTGSDSGDFYWLSGAEDQTETALGISNYVGTASTSTPIASRPAQFAGVSNSQYLHIDVSTPLSRTINPANAEGGPAAQAIGDGIYLDTLVQFTAADQVFGTDALGTGDKIAIEYAETDDGITNFVIRAGYVGDTVTKTNYVMNPVADFDVTAWHRLTVRAIANVGSQVGSDGFVVYLDGTALTYSTSVAAGNAAYENALNSTIKTYLYNSNTHALLPSAVAYGETGYGTLSAVAFQGNGSIDDISFTSAKPSFVVEGTTVTIAWDANVATYTVVDSNNKTLVDAAVTSGAEGSTNLTLDAGVTTLTVTATYAEGYEAGTWTNEGGSLSGGTFTVANGATLNIVSMVPMFDVGGVHYGTFEKALEAAVEAGSSQSPATVKLMVNVSEAISFTEGYIVLDLNGKTLQGTTEEYTINNSGATLTIIDSATGGTVDAPTGEASTGALYMDGGSTVINGGTFTANVITQKMDEGDGADDLTLTGGAFADANYDPMDQETAFYLAKYVADGFTATYSNGYFTVGAAAPAPTSVTAPTAASNLVYDGTEKTGVAAGEGYTLTGTAVATNAGDYTATATLEDGYIWSDETTAAKVINWSIAAKTDAEVVVTLTSQIAEYTAQLAFPTASAKIGNDDVAGTPAWNPDTITEPNAGETNTYTVTFTVTTANYAGSTGTAMFKVWKAAAPAPADWVDPADIPAEATASEVYEDLKGTALANADAKALTEWASAQKVTFSEVTTAPATFEDAFLLNCAATAEAVAAAKEDFKMTITVNADGTVDVAAPGNYNVTPKIEGKQSLSDKTWHDKTEGDQFFRAVLDL